MLLCILHKAPALTQNVPVGKCKSSIFKLKFKHGPILRGSCEMQLTFHLFIYHFKHAKCIPGKMMQKYGEKYALTLVSAMENRPSSVDLEDNKQRIKKIKTRGSPRSLCTSGTSDYMDGQPLVCQNTCSRDWLLYMVRVIWSGWYRRGAMIGA